MAGVDTSIYANQAHVDPMAGVSNAVGIANQFTNRQLLQTELQRAQMDLAAKTAVGNAFQGAYNPDDGSVDTDAAGKAIAGDPNAAYGAPEAFHSAAELKHQNIGNTSAGTSLGQQQTNYLSGQIYPLFNDPKNPPTSSTVSGVISNAVHSGAIDPKTGTALTLEMLKNSRTPQQLKTWAQSRFAGALGASQAEPGASVTTPAGTTQLSKGQTAAAVQGGASPASPSPNAPASPGLVTEPGVGVAETYKLSTAQKNADYSASQAILGNARNLEAANEKLAVLDVSDAGAVGDAKNSVLKTLTALGFAPGTATMTREEAEKYLEKAKANLPAAQRSDMAQHLADVSNPNLNTSLAATKALAQSALGFSRMDAAVPFAWDAEHPNQVKGQTDPAYLQYRAKFMNSQDPDGFAFPSLSHAEQQAMITKKMGEGKKGKDGMTDAFRKFRNSIGVYQNSLDNPGAQQ